MYVIIYTEIYSLFFIELTCFKIASIEQLFAFYYKPPKPFTVNGGWNLFDPEVEFGRMGLGTLTDAWRLTTINHDFNVYNYNLSI